MRAQRLFLGLKAAHNEETVIVELGFDRCYGGVKWQNPDTATKRWRGRQKSEAVFGPHFRPPIGAIQCWICVTENSQLQV